MTNGRQSLQEQDAFKSDFCLRGDSGDYQLSENHSKYLWKVYSNGKYRSSSLTSITFLKEQYAFFVKVKALQIWFYLKSRSLKTTGSMPRRYTCTSRIFKRYIQTDSKRQIMRDASAVWDTGQATIPLLWGQMFCAVSLKCWYLSTVSLALVVTLSINTDSDRKRSVSFCVVYCYTWLDYTSLNETATIDKNYIIWYTKHIVSN